MSKLKIKGIWLSKEILDIPELNIKEKMILALSFAENLKSVKAKA